MMKRIVALILCIAMALTMCSCGNNGNSGGNGEQVTITFSCWETGTGKEVMIDAIERFEEENPDINVEIMFIPSEYQIKMTAMSVSDTLPDMGYFTENSVLLWAQNDKLLDLTDMFEESPLSDKLDMCKFTDADGKVVAASVANEVLLLFYNKDLFDEAGLAYPPANVEDAWTWDEFVEVAKKLTKDRDGNTADAANFDSSRIRTYGANLYQNNLIFETLMWSNGGGIVDYETEEILLDKPETIEVLQALQDAIYVHHVSPTPTMQSAMPSIAAALTSGTVAMVMDMQNNVMLLDQAAKDEGLNYGIGVIPKFKESVSVNGGSPIVIFESTEHPEECKRLFTFLMDPSNMTPLLNNGLWMANETKWYTEEEYRNQWLNEEVHVEEYKSAVIDYTMSGSVRQNSYFYYPYSSHLLGSAWAAIDQVYRNAAKPEDAVEEVIEVLQDTIEYVNSPDFEME